MEADGSDSPLASLYVTDLHPDVTVACLYKTFIAAGPLVSIRVCRDPKTGHSLGYGYVNFQRPADAERALATLNFELINNSPIRIMWSQRDKGLRESGTGDIFLRNLEESIDNQTLQNTFSTFGKILSCKVACDEKGGSRGFGFIQFETKEAADKAISKMNGMLLNERKVFVDRFKSPQEREAELRAQAGEFTNVYVKNFKDNVDDQGLRDLFSQFGKTLSVKVMRDEHGHSRGFGFVSFEKHEDAQKAVSGMNGKEVEGQILYVGRAQTKLERQGELKRQFEHMKQERATSYQGVNLYVKNLDDVIDDEALRKAFSPYGVITSAKVMTANGRSKGFGFVCYSSPKEAETALKEMNGKILSTRPLYVALAQRKAERKAVLSSYHAQSISSPPHTNGPVFPQPIQPINYFLPAMPQVTAGFQLSCQASRYSPSPVALIAPVPRWINFPPRSMFLPPCSVSTINTVCPASLGMLLAEPHTQTAVNIGTHTMGTGSQDFPSPAMAQGKDSSAVPKCTARNGVNFA